MTTLLRTPPTGGAILIAFWWLAGVVDLLNPLVVPRVELVAAALLDQVLTSTLWYDALMTTYRAVAGLALSCLLGIPAGLLLGQYPAVYRHAALPIDFIRSIPAATLFPVFILTFGIGEESKIASVFFGCSFIMLVAALYGARGTSDRNFRLLSIQTMGANRWQTFRHVVVPDSITNILAGLRVSASIAFVLVVVTEMFLGANDGLGKRIYDFYLGYRVPDMYSALFVLGFIGYAANAAVQRAEASYRRRLGQEL